MTAPQQHPQLPHEPSQSSYHQPEPKPMWPWVLGAVGVLIVVLFAGCLVLIGTAANEVDSAADQQAPREVAGIGVPVRDGRFEFTVTKIELGVAKVGNDFFGATAQGQFVLVHLTVKNIGDAAQYFDGSSQKLFDAKGRQFSADSAAAIYLDQSQPLLNQVDPGNGVAGIVVFDVPKDTQPTKIELHGSASSGGVTVALR